MEIRVESWVFGRDRYDEIMRKYGSKQRVKALARRGDVKAREANVDLAIFEESPAQLDRMLRTTDIYELEPGDLERLTPERLKLLERITTSKKAVNVTKLCKALRRDKKNVSQDLRVLESLGLLTMEKVGREAIPRPPAGQIHIVIDQAA